MRASLALALLAGACADEPPPPEREEAAAAEAPAAAAAAPEPDERFRYTRLADCTVTVSVPEEAGHFEQVCEGLGGYRLLHIESDLRETLVVLAPDGTEHDLDLTVLAGGAFNSLGETVEWRGEARPGGFAPTALIARHYVMEDPDPQVPEVSYLVVARLAPEPCVVARVGPGPGQNERARQAADRGGACRATSA